MIRTHLCNFRVTEDEREKLKALADAEGEPASAVLRRMVRQQYAARFGDVAPRKLGAKGGR